MTSIYTKHMFVWSDFVTWYLEQLTSDIRYATFVSFTDACKILIRNTVIFMFHDCPDQWSCVNRFKFFSQSRKQKLLQNLTLCDNSKKKRLNDFCHAREITEAVKYHPSEFISQNLFQRVHLMLERLRLTRRQDIANRKERLGTFEIYQSSIWRKTSRWHVKFIVVIVSSLNFLCFSGNSVRNLSAICDDKFNENWSRDEFHDTTNFFDFCERGKSTRSWNDVQYRKRSHYDDSNSMESLISSKKSLGIFRVMFRKNNQHWLVAKKMVPGSPDSFNGRHEDFSVQSSRPCQCPPIAVWLLLLLISSCWRVRLASPSDMIVLSTRFSK